MTVHPAVFALCLLAAGFAALIFFLKRARYRRWVSTSGTVIGLIRRESDHGETHSISFSPRVSFLTSSGETVEFVSSVSSFPSPAVGDIIAVLYDPTDPREATVDRFMFRHLGEIVVFALGIAGVLVYVYQRFVA